LSDEDCPLPVTPSQGDVGLEHAASETTRASAEPVRIARDIGPPSFPNGFLFMAHLPSADDDPPEAGTLSFAFPSRWIRFP
jgi:hypothetical protein